MAAWYKVGWAESTGARLWPSDVSTMNTRFVLQFDKFYAGWRDFRSKGLSSTPVTFFRVSVICPNYEDLQEYCMHAYDSIFASNIVRD